MDFLLFLVVPCLFVQSFVWHSSCIHIRFDVTDCLAYSRSRMPLYDPFQLSPTSGQSSAASPQVLPGPLGADHVAQVEHRLYQAAIGIELTQTVDSPAGLTVTRAERAPDVKAALAVLSALKPDKWRDDRPVTAIQFVIHAPPVSQSSAAWLEQYGPSSGPAGRVIEGTVQTVGLLQNEPGGLDPTGSGPVPDPVGVPQRRSDRP